MKKKEFYELVTKELCGVATDQELEQLWKIVANSNLQQEYQSIKDNWDEQLSEVGASTYNIHSVRQKIISGIQEVEPDFDMGVSTKSSNTFQPRQFLRIAAVITLLILSGIVLLNFSSQQQTDEAVAVVWTEKTTQPGQTSTITFHEGSTIVLNGNSSIRYPEKFDEQYREVYFNGEGYFDISTDPQHPFIVHMDGYAVKVVGTVFNINHSDPNAFEVALLEGKVLVGEDTAEDKVALNPGEQAAFDRINKRVVIEPFDPAEVMGWKDKLYVFEEEPLTSVLQKLERRYGVAFDYKKEQVSKCVLTASFDDESVWTILEAINYATGLSYQLGDGRVVQLIGKGCN
ncbi:FecR family protein [Marinoscillum pacificum]|uniref:FecR family protein n=1 Tax=Marinoscillum pacificum TaxID=392723 RepID=UPI002158A0F8|nr:FecR family protein [Marinoscillum pacificum]